MLFNSYIFIFMFLPLCVLGFYLLKDTKTDTAKAWLIAFSLWFYGYFNLYYLAIMIGSVAVNYALYRFICVTNRKKQILAVGVAANIAVLFYFKYYDFFAQNINALFKSNIAMKNILLPLGISFFTIAKLSPIFLKSYFLQNLDINCVLLFKICIGV